jgi:hypothetical protein
MSFFAFEKQVVNRIRKLADNSTVDGGTDYSLEAHRLDNETIKSNNTMTKYVYHIHEVVF